MRERAEHPDRAATTLADHARRMASADHAVPVATISRSDPAFESGIDDARVDLQLLWGAVDRAFATRATAAARDWLNGLDTPQFRAGTIQDGTARGLRARLEEAISLCSPAPPDAASQDLGADPEADVIVGKDLRRKRDILIASDGVRIRFSRKLGIQLIDRATDTNAPHFLQFDDQCDVGCLDRFVPAENTRARIFSPAFLSAEQLSQGRIEDRLVLSGRLGRRRGGFECRLTLVGRKDEGGIRLRVEIDNRLRDHRMRIRFLGAPDREFLSHRGSPGFRVIHNDNRGFIAATLVRACGRLRVGESWVATPDAQVQGPIEHTFGLGMDV